MTQKKGLIFNIERFAIHDGPGIRTLVFFSSCPLRCLWCQNPEGLEYSSQLMLYDNLCVYDKCRKCIKVCPLGAITISEEGKLRTNRELCRECTEMSCAKVCPTGARVVVGEWMSVGDVLKEVEKDMVFYRKSGGGVTLSGGEPAMQSDFASELLKQCHERGIHTVMETCGYAEFERMKGIIEHLDLVFYDIKHIDPVKHREFTEKPNELILRNAERISREGVPMIIRIPLVPGYTDSETNIEAIAKFASTLDSLKEVELLPYHRLAITKYAALGKEYRLTQVAVPKPEDLQRLERIVRVHARMRTAGSRRYKRSSRICQKSC